MNSGISVVILTFNEEQHIERCIKSLLSVVENIYVVDSYSSDDTVRICESLGAKVYQRTWKNYADQFQWGLDNCPIDTEWVMRMDADEYLEADLIKELPQQLIEAEDNISGFYIRRKYFFLGRWIKYGAVYPLHLLRVWRAGSGRIESRWMDEHIILDGAETKSLSGHIVDDNLNNTRWYIDKHNNYADREMIDIISKKYGLFEENSSVLNDKSNFQARIKRIIKENLYNQLPIFIRPTLYFIYRYFIRFGFLDGTKGFAFHFMQGYWYRVLVDLRVYEAERVLSNATNDDERIAFLELLTGLKLR
jgi:glycosyltransferase involved in cell wall biosynthesis